MALTNQERVGKAVELLRDGLRPFVERELAAVHGPKWAQVADLGPDRPRKGDPLADPQALLAAIWFNWEQVFKRKLSQTERTLVSELRDIRNRWAHHEPFTTDDAYRALDSGERLLKAVSAPQAAEVERQRKEVMRLRYEEEAKREVRKVATAPVEGQPLAGLRPWREIVTPHADVASGRYQLAEFMADLSQVHRGEGSDEYKKPKDFFRRTYVTEGIRRLLVGALQRLAGPGGDPVVELQTSFGGGKTHSMLALYHLFSGAGIADLPGIEPVLKEAGVSQPPKAKRAVFVGTAPSVADTRKMPDGTRVHTMWGDLAWQLAEKKGYAVVAEADKRGVSPGSDALRQLLSTAAPCLILIDEWVAYVRLLYGIDGLPGGSFDSNLTFAQSLTEAARGTERALVVATLPQSAIELGGEAGAQALVRLEHTFRRIGAAWAPATAEESFEIVRRRLFEPIEAAKAPLRDAVVRAFSAYYRENRQEFPQGCGEGAYEQRLLETYPVHAELFERLYGDWSTLERFQRTRGVLRLMAEIIQVLWDRQDASLLIMPAHVPLDVASVQNEIARYLPSPWPPVIDREVDGPNSLPLTIDRENPNLGRYSAARRVARTIFLGSAPHAGVAHMGLDDRRIKLGSAQPGESAATFGDALRRLSDRAVHLFQDGARYWYSLQQNVTRTAHDRAAQLRAEEVFEEIRRRLREAASDRGPAPRPGEPDSRFDRVHPCPSSPGDVSDEPEARLVLLDPEHPHIKDEWASLAAVQASGILDSRGASPRRNRNALVFLAADKARLETLESAARLYLAWHSMERDREALNLDPFQLSQVRSKVKETDETVRVRIPEAYAWLLIPEQERGSDGKVDPQGRVVWQNERLQPGPEGLAARAARKLKGAEWLLTSMGATRLRMELDRIPLWRGSHVSVRQLAEDFTRYLYLPRLRSPDVLRDAIEDGVGLVTWQTDAFAYAESWDQESERYRALRGGQRTKIDLEGEGLVVKSEVAAEQLAREAVPREAPREPGEEDLTLRARPGEPLPASEAPVQILRRFHGSVALDPTRTGRDAGRIAEEVIQHLTTLRGAKVTVTLEIRADVPDGAPESTVRTVGENCRTLKFTDHGFEEE